MKKLIFLLALSLSLPGSYSIGSEEGPKHGEGEEHHHEEGEEEHGHGDEEKGREEENSAIGADKGILEKGKEGFKLSKESVASFGLKFADAQSTQLEIPKTALVTIKSGKFIYRLRDGWIKRLPARVLSRNEEKLKIEAEGLSPSDQIVVAGVGFVRGAELIVEEGASHGHSH